MTTDATVPELGTRVPGARYVARTCVYGVALDGGRVLVVRYHGRLGLPGGSLEDGESERDALLRETLEESGYDVRVGALIGRARQLVSRANPAKYRDKACSFYVIEPTADRGAPTEPGHVRVWLAVAEARDALAYESHAWALDRATQGMRNTEK